MGVVSGSDGCYAMSMCLRNRSREVEMNVAAFDAVSTASLPRVTSRSGLTSMCLLTADYAAIVLVGTMMIFSSTDGTTFGRNSCWRKPA